MLIGRGSFTVLSACAEVIPSGGSFKGVTHSTLCMRRGDPNLAIDNLSEFEYSLHAQR